MLLALKFLGLSFSALLPVINPIGSALLLLSIVGPEKPYVYHVLARKIAITTVFFLLAIDIAGAAVLGFFGISLPVVQLAGGLVLAAMGWNLLNQTDVAKENGVGCVACALRVNEILDEVFAQIGILGGIIVNCIAIYLSYAYAQKLTVKISRQTIHGVLRVIAFILLCIGVQIAWKGLAALIASIYT